MANHALAVCPAIDSCAPRRSAADRCKSARAACSDVWSLPHRSTSQVVSSETPWFVNTVLSTSSSAPGIGKPTKFCLRRLPLYDAWVVGRRAPDATRASGAACSRHAAAARSRLRESTVSMAADNSSSPKSVHHSGPSSPAATAAPVHSAGIGTASAGHSTGSSVAQPAPMTTEATTGMARNARIIEVCVMNGTSTPSVTCRRDGQHRLLRAEASRA